MPAGPAVLVPHAQQRLSVLQREVSPEIWHILTEQARIGFSLLLCPLVQYKSRWPHLREQPDQPGKGLHQTRGEQVCPLFQSVPAASGEAEARCKTAVICGIDLHRLGCENGRTGEFK